MRKKLEYYQPGQSDIVQRIEDRELRRGIYRAIQALPDKCREVFKLSYLYDMKNKDIADALGISPRTVEAHIHKALKLLRASLSPLRESFPLFLLSSLSLFEFLLALSF